MRGVDPYLKVYKMGLPEYSVYGVKEGLASLGGEAYLVQAGDKMKTFAIHYNNEWLSPDHGNWDRAQKVVMATLGTDLTVIQHLLNTHLIIAGTFSAITDKLSPGHVLRELLHPYTLATLGINNYNVPILLRKGAMFDSIYSFAPENLVAIINDKIAAFDIREMDPTLDIENRQVSDLVESTDLPFGYSEREIWNEIKTHVREYIDECYVVADDILRDSEVVAWYEDLKRCIPHNQIESYAPELNNGSLVDLITLFIYTASVNHDLVGVMTYHYLPWMNHLPSKVNVDGSAPSLAVVKLAANLLLATQPTSLSTVVDNSYSELVSDPQRRQIVERLRGALADFQSKLDAMNLSSDALASITQPRKQIPSVHS